MRRLYLSSWNLKEKLDNGKITLTRLQHMSRGLRMRELYLNSSNLNEKLDQLCIHDNSNNDRQTAQA